MRRVVLVVIAGAGCGDNLRGGIVERTAHVALTYPEHAPVCSGTIGYLERAAQAQAAVLGVELPVIEYYTWHPADWESGPCSIAAGCFVDGAIESPYPDIAHELVHAMREPSVKVIEEGLAVALGDDYDSTVVDIYLPVLSEQLEVPALDFDDYEEAGDFMSYVIAADGPAVAAAIARALPKDTPTDERFAAFTAVYGRSIDAAARERWDTAWRFRGGTLNVPACAADPLAWDGTTMHLEVACDDGGIGVGYDTSGYFSPAVRRQWTIDIAEDGLYRVDVDAYGKSELMTLDPCPLGPVSLGFDTAFHFAAGASNGPAFVYLRAGRYAVAGSSEWPHPGSFDVEITPAAVECAMPIEVGPGSSTIKLSPHPTSPIELAVRAETTTTLGVSYARDTVVEVCLDCGATCTELPEAGELEVAAGHTVLVRADASVWGGIATVAFRAP